MTQQGTLYGIGVGPGDPELLTLKAIRILGRTRHIFASSSSKNSFSLAESILRPHLSPGVEVARLRFPMTSDNERLQRAWTENAECLLERLDQGQDVALVTLGDPLLYSTFGYVLRTVQNLRPAQPVRIVPGVTSFQQAAALTGTILAEANEALHILPGTMPPDELDNGLASPGNHVVLKAYRNFSTIRASLAQRNLTRDTVFASRIGLADEHIQRGLEGIPDTPNYLSLLLVKPTKK